MAYEPTKYNNNFNASVQKFNAVKAIDYSSKIREQNKQEVENIGAMAKDAARQYDIDQRNLKTQGMHDQAVYDAERRGAEVDNAFRKANDKAFQGLLSLTSTGMEFYQQKRAEWEANQEKEMEAADKLEGLIGANPGIEGAAELTPEDNARLDQEDMILEAEAQASTAVAEDSASRVAF